MDIRTLRYFVEVVRQQSFTRAAGEIICHPAHHQQNAEKP
ncbi:LysR family regulatory protein [Salmonella enterica subsp. arizonae]|uniref:LysR family regulatory protein n=1 Tax=Salmonella enterica subsp. arizonae TaxID=59203 RepID=A0A379TJ03_SALER|nr:LysR family regulatory protein [Salmonella enterica subsp. arizonae]